jgi:hypothetical protein
MLAQGSDNVDSYTFVAQNYVAEPQDQGSITPRTKTCPWGPRSRIAVSICHFSPVRISIRR